MQKQITIVALILACLVGSASAWAQEAVTEETQYLEILRDVPVMPGLVYLEGTNMVFDKPEGRIAGSYFYSETLTNDDLEAFYSGVLPQLGWEQKLSLLFVREGEQLTLDTQGGKDGITVEFLLSPYVTQP